MSDWATWGVVDWAIALVVAALFFTVGWKIGDLIKWLWGRK